MHLDCVYFALIDFFSLVLGGKTSGKNSQCNKIKFLYTYIQDIYVLLFEYCASCGNI